MKIKRLLAIISVFSLFACLAVIPASAEEINFIEVFSREESRSGLAFDIGKLLAEVDNPYEGYYIFIFTVEDFFDEDPEYEGLDYKVVTQGGMTLPTDFPYLRFTERGPMFMGETTITARIINGEREHSADRIIPENFLRRAAGYNHIIAICTDTDPNPPSFIVKNIIVKHVPDGNEDNAITVYEMASDPVIQGLTPGAEYNSDTFPGGSSGLVATDEFWAHYRVVKGDAPEGANTTGTPPVAPPVTDTPVVTDTPTDTDDTPADTAAPQPDNTQRTTTPSSGEGGGSGTLLIVLIAVIGVALLGATGGALVLMKK